MNKLDYHHHDNYDVTEVCINSVSPGDTIIHNNIMKTVCPNNIGRDSLLGKTLWGDSYKSGSVKVKLVTFK